MPKSNFAYIDNSNVNYSVSAQHWKLNWGEFRKYLAETHNVSVAYMFLGYVKEQEDMYTFFESLGYSLVFKPVTEVKDELKGNIDAELVLQTMIDYPHYEKAVIVTGDGDIACLVEHLNKHNKLETLIIPNERRYSEFLKIVAGDKITYLAKL